MLRLITIVVLVHVYIGWRLIADLPCGAGAAIAMIFLLVLSASAMPFGEFARRSKHSPMSDHLAGAGFVAMGFFSSLLVLTLMRELILLAAAAASIWLSGQEALLHQLHVWSAAAVPVVALFLTFVGFINARRRAVVRNVDVPIAGLPAQLHGFSIVQISDIHVGTTIKNGYVSRIVDAVNALDADMIAITGDLVDGSVQRLSSHTQPLRQLAARHGTFFVTGNHEYYSGAQPWIDELRRLGVQVLVNQHVVLRHPAVEAGSPGASLVVAGVADFSAHHFMESHRSDPDAALKGAPADVHTRLLLAHQPRSAQAAAQAGFQLQLSGHTHGGQIWPWNHFVRYQQPFTVGLNRLHQLWVYTNSGTGYWGPPKRFGVPSEITHLRLVAAS